MMAKVEIAPEYDLPAVAEAAGQPDFDKRWYSGGYLHVEGVTQEALEAAVANAQLPPFAVQLKARVDELRAAKLAVGFDYDFGDTRGVHRFGTTPADRAGWAEVKALADAAMQAGNTTLEIAIRTDTGDTTIRAQEWPAIQLAAAQVFQPVWMASWAIKDAIEAGTVTTFAEIDAHEAWPADGTA